MKLNPVTSATRIPLMANGTIDLECGSTTNNAEREKQVWFTNSHFLTATRYVSKKSANLHTIEDLKGKTVVSTSGTTNIKQINEANTERKLGLTILPAKDHAEAFLMVETGRAVAFVMDDVLLASLAASSKDPSAYEISTEALSKPEPYGIMLRKDDTAFKKVADDATAKLYTSPDGKALYDKWFTQADPAAQHQPQPADERGDEEAVHHADLQPRSGCLLRSFATTAHRRACDARDRRTTIPRTLHPEVPRRSRRPRDLQGSRRAGALLRGPLRGHSG